MSLRFLWGAFARRTADAWERFANETGAEYTPVTDSVTVRVKQWPVVLDTSGTSYAGSYMTRMRGVYVSRDGFWFELYRRDIWSRLQKALGTQVVETLDPPFDREFTIKSNDELKVRTLLEGGRLRELAEAQIQRQGPSTLSCKRSTFRGVRPEVHEVRFQEGRILTDVQRLKGIYQLVVETLNQLSRIGSASDENPNVQL